MAAVYNPAYLFHNNHLPLRLLDTCYLAGAVLKRPCCNATYGQCKIDLPDDLLGSYTQLPNCSDVFGMRNVVQRRFMLDLAVLAGSRPNITESSVEVDQLLDTSRECSPCSSLDVNHLGLTTDRVIDVGRQTFFHTSLYLAHSRKPIKSVSEKFLRISK